MTSGADSGPGSLRAALTEAGQVADGPDIIKFAPNVKTVTLTTESLRNSSPVTIAAPNVTIRRSSDANTPNFGLFITSASLTIEGAKLTGGNAPAVGGGAIWAPMGFKTITLNDVTISGNYGINGGGLRLDQDTTLNISNSVINNNSAAFGGCIVASTFRGITITDTSISGNKADSAAAGSIRGPFTLNGVNVSSNQASNDGGGLIVQVLSNVPGNSVISNSQFRNNSAGSIGGALQFSGDGLVTVENSVFSGNTAASSGGAIFVFGSNQIGISSLVINDSTLNGNQGTSGGAIAAQGKTSLQLNRSNVANNVASLSGGGIYSAGSVGVESSSIIRNQALGQGGGIASIGNTSNPASVTVVNSTISSNQANEAGAIYSQNSLMLLSSTVAFNQANTTGGIAAAGSDEFFRNTLISNNIAGSGTSTVPSDISGTVTDAAFTLVGDAASSGGIVNGVNQNRVGVNPQLGPLRKNSGTTFTHAIDPDSPAVDSGDNFWATITKDQRGAPRIRLGQADMGAYELQPNLRQGTAAYVFTDFDAVNDSVSLVRNTAGNLVLSRLSQKLVLPNGDAVNQIELTGSYSEIVFNLAAGDDRLLLNLSNGWNSGVTKLTANFGTGSDTLLTSGDADVRLTATTLTISNGINFTLSHSGLENATLKGGAGSNVMDARGFAGNTVIDAAAGSDTLFGGSGRNILIGGTGTDIVNGNLREDILIGGRLALNVLSSNFAKLSSLWASNLSYDDRVSRIRLGTGLPTGVRLSSSTVIEDNVQDRLRGNAARDWFWSHPSDFLADRANNELIQ